MRELSEGEIDAVLLWNGIGTLALNTEGVPYPIPMSFGFDEEKPLFVMQFGELTDIRERTGASWGHKWAFNRLYDYVEYKAAEYGIDVEQVDPENTSRRCSECGFTHPDNRENESFRCLKCGYENHAEYNAAKNIGLRYLRRNQTGSGGGAPVGVRLNSGTLNANGEFDPPAEDSARPGVHAESPPL